MHPSRTASQRSRELAVDPVRLLLYSGAVPFDAAAAAAATVSNSGIT